MKPRLVLLRIDGPDAKWIWVTEFNSDEADGQGEDYKLPVPEDDQLTRDLDKLTKRYALLDPNSRRDPEGYGDSARRLRAWAGLEEE